MSWDIVVWKDEDQVSYVPSCWANATNTLYKFPTSQNEVVVRKYIHDCNDLKVEFNWNAAEAKKLNILSIKEAKKYCEKAEYTSQLDTNDENDNKEVSLFGRRRRRKKISTSSDSEISNTSVLENENEFDFIDVNGKTKRIQETQHQQKTKNVKRFQSLVGSEQHLQTKNKAHVENQFSSQRNYSSLSQPTSMQNAYKDLSRHTVSKQRLLLARTRSKSLDKEENLELPHNAPPSTTDVKIYKQLTEIKFELKDVSQRIANIELLLMNFMASAPTSLDTGDFSEFLDKLPLSNVADINTFNSHIEQDRPKFKKLVQLLFLIGGDSPKKIIYGQISKLLTNEVCKEYSGVGKTKKKSFTELKLYDAIVVATRKRMPETSESDIKKIIGLYLTTYKSRLKKPLQEVDRSNISSVANNSD